MVFLFTIKCCGLFLVCCLSLIGQVHCGVQSPPTWGSNRQTRHLTMPFVFATNDNDFFICWPSPLVSQVHCFVQHSPARRSDRQTCHMIVNFFVNIHSWLQNLSNRVVQNGTHHATSPTIMLNTSIAATSKSLPFFLLHMCHFPVVHLAHQKCQIHLSRVLVISRHINCSATWCPCHPHHHVSTTSRFHLPCFV